MMQMADRRQKLELTWDGKDARFRLEPRILLEEANLSYHASKRVRDDDRFDNVLIHGDNLLALRALQQTHAGTVKCVYIDPPFNTGQAFEHYDDGVQHSVWLDLMARRLTLLHTLLRDDGILFVHLDQEEVHYLKIILDEIFGRSQFLGQIAYERSGVSGIGQGGTFLVNTHEFIVAYAKDKSCFRAVNLQGEGELDAKAMKRYNRVLLDPGRRAEVGRFTAPSTGEPVVIYRHSGEKMGTISLRNFSKREHEIREQYAMQFESVFRLTSIQAENEFQNRILAQCGDGLFSADYLVSRGKKEGEMTTSYYCDGQAAVWLKDTAQVQDGKIIRTGKLSDFWSHADIPKADLANEGGVNFRRGKKPENLLRRLLRIATNPGDLVLDSFAGSGTTGAVAHKMGRRWIMIESGEHLLTHIIPRLKSIIEGRDKSGVTGVTEWRGGGGFRAYRLAPSLLETDRWNNWVVSKSYNAAMLAEAMCKLEGFRYEPDPATFWRHGRSTENDFIYVTTQNLSRAQLQFISDQVGPSRTLLICCGAFRAQRDDFPNLTLKKIPQAVLHRCEWGRDDYSLNVQALPPVEAVDAPGVDGDAAESSKQAPAETRGAAKRQSKKPARGMQQLPLFDGARKEKGKR